MRLPLDDRCDVETPRIRVLQFLPNFGLGGTERLTVDLARRLNAARFEVHFGCLRRWGELLPTVIECGMPITEHQMGSLYSRSAWRERIRFARYLRRHRIQIVQAYNFHANAFAIPAARVAGVPVIVAAIQDTGGYLNSLQQRAQRVVCHLSRRIMVNAGAVRQWLIADGFDPDRLVVVHQGVDLSRFRRPRREGRLQRELGLPPQTPLVAVLARLIRLKGIEHFIAAAALVAAARPEVHFLVIGDNYFKGPDGSPVRDVAYREELERYGSRLGLDERLIFTGFREDIPEILADIAVSVLPSIGGEGLSNVLLEAMAAGVPVVATNVGGNAEAIQDGATGFVVPPRDPRALAGAITMLLENPQRAAQFGVAGRERVARYFSDERYARDVESLYLSLLASTRRSRRVPMLAQHDAH